MSDFVILGSIKDRQGNAVTDVKVEASDSDQQAFQDYNDDILGSVWVKDNGNFQILFDTAQFQDSWLEGGVDLYIRIRNKKGHIIYKSEIRKGIKPNDIKNLNFNIILDPSENKKMVPADPYGNSNEMVFGQINSTGEVIDLALPDAARNFALLSSAFNAWFLYTAEPVWRSVGYDGPQVPRYPWRNAHAHKLAWEQ